MAVSLLGIVQYDRYLFWVQADYVSLTTDQLDVQDQPEHASFESKMFLTETAVGYQLDGWAKGQTFDVLIGARTLHMTSDLTVDHLGTKSSKADLVDPMLILRPSIPVFPSKIKGLRFNPTLGIGGGGDAEMIYELQPQFQYQITETIAARVGYRRVGYKFKGDRDEDNEMDIALTGFIVGVGMTF
jgi:hypothetical protein